MSNIYACIMAGGVGSRFWPASRESMPKQFLDITGRGKSLIRQTYERFEKWLGSERILVVTHEKYRDQVGRHLPELPDSHIIGEPDRRNTAPAAYLGNAVAAKLGDDPVVIMAPADHVIEKEDTFLDTLKEAASYANQNPVLVTLGIQPTFAHTGFGYIEYEVGSRPYKVLQFTEKPGQEKATRFLKAGNYLWNAGIFIWKTSVLEDAYRKYAKELTHQFSDLTFHPEDGLDQDQLTSMYRDLKNISIDYLIMEKADNVCTLPGDFGWSDVGSWLAARELLAASKDENVVFPKNNIIRNSAGCYISSHGDKAVILDGLEGYLVVDTEDILMIYPLQKDQEIKGIRNEFIDKFGEEYS